MSLEDKIKNREAVVGVIGVGYVGLPLCVEMANAGFRVIGFEVDAKKVELLNKGISYIGDVDDHTIASLVAKGMLTATTDFSRISELDCVSICVPTPLNKTKDPDISYIVKASESVALGLHKDMLVILESTTYPGTTKDLALPLLEKSNLKVGEDFFLAFSPERVDPGQTRYGIKNTPKVVGGISKKCTDMASLFYGTFIDNIVSVSSTQVAETVKLLENTFRAVNIGLVNEIAIICRKLGLDVWEVIDAASTKPFGFMPFYPGPGLGGHCLPIDPLYLSWALKSLNYSARFIELASDINSSMPHVVINMTVDALNDMQKSVNGSKILVLGVAYKKNISDVRESPSLDIILDLIKKKAKVSYHDPYVPELNIDGVSIEFLSLEDSVLSAYDCVIIGTDHSCIDYTKIVEKFPLIIDTRNVTKNISVGLEKIRKL